MTQICCGICHQSYHFNYANRSDSENSSSGQTDDLWCCANRLPLPFNDLKKNTNEFYNVVNLEYTLHDSIKTELNNSKFNQFYLNDRCHIRSDRDIDPDINYLLQQISNDKCQYYVKDSINTAESENEFSMLYFNIRSIKSKYDELRAFSTPRLKTKVLKSFVLDICYNVDYCDITV